MSDEGADVGGEIGAADERALRVMFAALVEDAGPSELSPLAVQRAALAEERSAEDRRTKRIAYTRNALIAAVVIGVFALVVPHLRGASNDTAASSSAPAAPAGSSAAAGGGEVRSPASAAGGAAAATSAASGSAAEGTSSSFSAAAAAPAASAAGGGASGDAPSSGAASSAAATSAAAASSASVPSAASSAPASSGSAASSSSSGTCVSVPRNALADVRAALGGFRGEVRITSCTAQTSAGTGTGSAVFVVSRTGFASCAPTAPTCPVSTGTATPSTTIDDGFTGATVVRAGGITVTATATAGGPSRQALLAGARALVKALG